MGNFEATFKKMLGLGSDAMNFRDINQLDDAIKAVNKIAHIIGIEKADRFMRPVLTASGKIGGTKYIWAKGIGYVIDAQFDQKRMERGRKAPKDVDDTRTGLFGGIEHWNERIGIGLDGWNSENVVQKEGQPAKYKNSIPKDARQKVDVDVSTPALAKVNEDSAKRNKEFLIELSDISRNLIAQGEMSLNDYGMIMKAFQGATQGPLFAAAHVTHTTGGPINSTSHMYEHMIPRDVISMYLGSYVLGKTPKGDIKKILNQFTVAIVPRDQAKIFDKFYQSSMPKDWLLGDSVLKRYYNLKTFGKINLPLIDVRTGKVDVKSQVFADAFKRNTEEMKDKETLRVAMVNNRTVKESKGITVLDFDDTLATTKSLVKYTRPDGTTGTLNAEQYASQYQDLLAQGYKFDFTEFDKVVKGKLAPLFQ